MNKKVIEELLEMQRRGIEPYFTDEGWAEFWRLVVEDEENVEKSA
jgi:hypothetical protein